MRFCSIGYASTLRQLCGVGTEIFYFQYLTKVDVRFGSLADIHPSIGWRQLPAMKSFAVRLLARILSAQIRVNADCAIGDGSQRIWITIVDERLVFPYNI